MAWLQQQQQLILRLPEPLAKVSRRILYKDKGKNNAASPNNDFIFTLNGQDYPALLMNLPTPVETHKTFDSKIFLKSGDIGQLLQVFETEEQREAMRASICHTIHGDYMPSGLTPPTADIVKRRFEQTRKNDGNFIPYRIRNVAQEMSSFGNGTGRMVNATTGEVVADGNANTPGPVLEVVSETVTEEVVDFEEWMVDQAAMQHGRREGVSITLHGSQLGSLRELQSGGTEQARSLLLLLQHPELLITEEDREEDDIDALAAEQAREQRARAQQETAGSDAMEVEPSGSAGAGTGTATAGSSSSAARVAAPLKLSLSMLRTGASAVAGASKALEDTDAAMVQDEVGDTGNAEEEGEDGNVSENEAEDDGGDEEGDDDDEGEDAEGREGGDEGTDAYYGAPAAWQMQQAQQQQQYAQVQQSATSSSVAAMLAVSDDEGEEQGGEQAMEEAVPAAGGADENSVNSDDSDAWMREV